ncbi:hypothetical protein [Actinacidiphila oryziradicis]|uniref:Uncharacterized protein n=1 Tax=Actinacidiphila oryziradicis TaxID=2571141 RepID=A0A4U0S6A5_9ACTN|nr:hypothetical protein [Actinacidiphila oryziradicis]TKA04630.1 hypothetical protein FCI23_35265 [Actinacidiphila oryziradicis]
MPALRARELSVVWRYEHTLADFLRVRYAARPDGTVRADVVAGADHALDYVRGAWSEDPAVRAAGGRDEVDAIALVSRRARPMWRVIQGVDTALDKI